MPCHPTSVMLIRRPSVLAVPSLVTDIWLCRVCGFLAPKNISEMLKRRVGEVGDSEDMEESVDSVRTLAESGNPLVHCRVRSGEGRERALTSHFSHRLPKHVGVEVGSNLQDWLVGMVRDAALHILQYNNTVPTCGSFSFILLSPWL